MLNGEKTEQSKRGNKMLKRIAVWYLRKRNASVILNIKVSDGLIKVKGNQAQIYDNEFNNTKFITEDNQEFLIPDNKAFNFHA